VIGLTAERFRVALAWIVVALVALPVGGAVVLGVVHGDTPCILCWAQRTSMALIALVGLFVIRYGPRPRYLGMAILLATWGVFMALRHSALHLARDVGQGFAPPILGLHTYVWSGIIHFSVLVVIGVLLLLLRGGLGEQETDERGTGNSEQRGRGWVGQFAMGLFVVVVGANAVQAIVTTGPPPFIGQADPVRFSFNPSRWVWSLEELGGRVSLRGAWTIPAPDPAGAPADPDPAHGPLPGLPVLEVSRWERIGAPLEGLLTDFAAAGPRTAYLALTDRYGVYLLDSTLSRVEHHVVLDPGFAIDLSPIAGGAFLGDTVAVVSTNKSYVLLRPDPEVNPDTAWRRFLETDGTMAELRRSRFQTVRARQMYVRSLAYDPESAELITVGVPSPRHRRLVVSRFARSDFLLSSEFEPAPGPGLPPLAEGRSLAEYVVTGAAVGAAWLYAISTEYSTLLLIDLRRQVVWAAYAVPGIERPVGLAVRGPELLVAQADGRIAVLRRPGP
jgi:disulfide bond formation protein DsbB